MQEMHQGVGGGHFSTTIISCKILDAQYWWCKILYKDVREYWQSYDDCQHT
jgi:hypothetical protein